MRAMSKSPIEVVDYDPAWPAQFEALRAVLEPALEAGGVRAFTIEHVGSTAVPGLAAKPILDIDILLATAEDLTRTIPALAAIGYAHRGDLGIAGREAFDRRPGGVTHHLYAGLATARPLREHLVFRDRLRADPDARDRYAALKRRLAITHAEDRTAYNDAKTALVRELTGPV